MHENIQIVYCVEQTGIQKNISYEGNSILHGHSWGGYHDEPPHLEVGLHAYDTAVSIDARVDFIIESKVFPFPPLDQKIFCYVTVIF